MRSQRRKTAFKTCFAAVLACALAACESESAHRIPESSALIEGRSGRRCTGFASFTEVPGGVSIVVDVQNVTPGLHGLHIAEFGNCDAVNASSAGGHFDPHGAQHGSPDAPVHHAGDLGNIQVDASGAGHYERVVAGLTVGPGPFSVTYRAIVLNERRDDFESQPAGDAGARIACGVILPRK